MKRNVFQILIKKYKFDIFSFVVNISAVFVAFRFKDDDQNYLVFWVSIILFSLSILVIIYWRTMDKVFYYLPMNKPGEEKNWSGRGKLFYIRNEKSYEITESNEGYIFTKTLTWDDYTLEFNFKLINKCLAWIVRASNLSNYLMFQCNFDGINPHIRLDGQWMIIKKHDDPDVNLSFDRPLCPDTWYRAIIVCEKRTVRLLIYDKKDPLFDRHWAIPDQLVATYKTSTNPDNRDTVQLLQSLDFDLGAIGFRNHGNEKGLVKNIFIEKL